MIIRFLFLFSSALCYSQNWDIEKIEVTDASNSCIILGSKCIYDDQWESLPQAMFWKQIMQLSPDSCLINVAATRVVLKKMAFKTWNSQTETQKALFKDSLRKANDLSFGEQLFVTTGKSDFYLFNARFIKLFLFHKYYVNLYKSKQTKQIIQIDLIKIFNFV